MSSQDRYWDLRRPEEAMLDQVKEASRRRAAKRERERQQAQSQVMNDRIRSKAQRGSFTTLIPTPEPSRKFSDALRRAYQDQTKDNTFTIDGETGRVIRPGNRKRDRG